MERPRLLANSRNVLGEGPIWCPVDQVLYWLDVLAPSLWRLDVASGEIRQRALPRPPGCLALIDGGGILLAIRSRLGILDTFDAPTLRWIDTHAAPMGDERFNDGKVDRRGRFWVGTLDRHLTRPVGKLYRFEGPARLACVDEGFALSNGMGWSPDGRTMYFAESQSRRVYRYDVDGDRGTLSNRRVFTSFAHEGPGIPDGLTVDAEGGVWVALFGQGCVQRFDPDGGLALSVPLPVSRPTSCIFGGPALRTLYVTTATFGLDAVASAGQPMAGGVIAIDTPFTGLPEPRVRLAVGASGAPCLAGA